MAKSLADATRDYDTFYENGGFNYSEKAWLPRIKKLCKTYRIQGKVLDMPCGDGFWSRILAKCRCQVTSADISEVGARLAKGIVADMNRHYPEWDDKFDWVFCRGPSHLHTNPIENPEVFGYLTRYAPSVLVVYATDQSEKDTGNHYHHTKADLDAALAPYGLAKSCVENRFYFAVLKRPENKGVN